ncbi:hypothetical protein [Halorussus lipolyticus]|uniref:hypothetical protein n=1 Tax=Halorussus lipolyticus TaxID=3034024 RepID=UPI0023E7C030|nr:hypothetical protein [Halorussus sp. DT80]
MAEDSDFDSELRDLLLTAFAEGETVAGERAVTTVPDQLPDWRVTIERCDEKGATSANPVGESP